MATTTAQTRIPGRRPNPDARSFAIRNHARIAGCSPRRMPPPSGRRTRSDADRRHSWIADRPTEHSRTGRRRYARSCIHRSSRRAGVTAPSVKGSLSTMIDGRSPRGWTRSGSPASWWRGARRRRRARTCIARLAGAPRLAASYPVSTGSDMHEIRAERVRTALQGKCLRASKNRTRPTARRGERDQLRVDGRAAKGSTADA